MSARIEVQIACQAPNLASVSEVRSWAGEVMRERVGSHELTVRIVDAHEGAELNHSYRNRTGPTNVLSFPFEIIPGTDGLLVGDIAVCAPVVQREAEAQGKTLREHCAHMVVHGTLHLLGFDHQCAQEAETMEAEEVEILARLGFSDPYRQRDVDV